MISLLAISITFLFGGQVQSDSLTFHKASNTAIETVLHTDIAQDEQGLFWISTNSVGVFQMNGTQKKQFRHDPFLFGSLPANDIWLMEPARHRGGMWVSSGDDGLSHWDPISEKFKTYHNVTPTSSTQRYVNLEEDFQGRLWLLTDQGVLDVYDPGSNKFDQVTKDGFLSKALGLASPSAILAFEDQWVLIGDNEGKNIRYDLDNGQYATIPISKTESSILFYHRDRFERIWMGNQAGEFFSYDKAFPSFNKIKLSRDIESCTIQNGIVASSQNGNLWFSSIDSEQQTHLCELNPETGVVRSIKIVGEIGNMIRKEQIQAIELGRHGSIWISSSSGVWVADTGILSDLNSRPELTSTITDAESAPTTIITEFLISGRLVKPESGGYLETAPSRAEEIVLPHTMNSFGFSFATLDFRPPNQNDHYYRLSPVQKEWTKTSQMALTRAQFDGLNPGKYIFEVRGFSSKGIESKGQASLRIVIKPPWFKTWYAYSLYVAGIIGLFYLIMTLKTRQFLRSRRKNLDTISKLKELDQMKTAVITNMSHEVRTPLTSIIGYAELLEGAKPAEVDLYANSISSGAKRLMRTLNSLLDLAQLQGNHIQLRPISNPILPCANAIIEEQGAIAIRNDVSLRLGQETSSEVWALTDSMAFERVLDNVISNAVKFTNEGEVIVDVFERKGRAIIRVKDTGIGISPEFLPHIFEQFAQESDGLARNFEGNGVGLSIAHHLLLLMKGKIEVESTKDQGSTFTISLPIGTPPPGYHKEIIGDTDSLPDNPLFISKTGQLIR